MSARLLEFLGVWNRIERAREHSEAFAEAWRRFLEDDPYETRLEIEDDGTGSVWIETRPLPGILTLELGEMLYQLRAALDSAVYAAAIVETGEDPPPDHEKLEFPVCRSARDFEKARWKIAPLSDQIRRIIESVQPYNAVEGLDPEILIFSPHRAIGMLHDWARKDRHRTLHVVGSWVSGADPLLRVPAPAFVAERLVANDCFLGDEHEVATFRIEGFAPGMDVKANANSFIDVAVDEIPHPCVGNDTLSNRTKAMAIYVKEIVRGFEKELLDRRAERA